MEGFRKMEHLPNSQGKNKVETIPLIKVRKSKQVFLSLWWVVLSIGKGLRIGPPII
jgi:hypothetical protein